MFLFCNSHDRLAEMIRAKSHSAEQSEGVYGTGRKVSLQQNVLLHKRLIRGKVAVNLWQTFARCVHEVNELNINDI